MGEEGGYCSAGPRWGQILPRGAGSDHGRDLVLPGQRDGFVQPTLPGMGTCPPQEPLSSPQEPLSSGKRQPWPWARAGVAPGETNICFLSG